MHDRTRVFERTNLEKVCHLITDGKHGDCHNADGSGYYFLSAKDVKGGKLQYQGARQITEEDFRQTHRRTQLEPLDILVSNSGTIGRMALVQDNELTRRTTFQKSVAILKPNRERVDPYWLLSYLQSEQERLVNTAGGTAQKNLLLRDLRAFDIELPPLPIQRKIADVLSAYDDLIEVNTRRIRILEQMAQSVYQEWFGKVDGKSMPRGWEEVGLFDVAEVTYGFPFASKMFSEQPVGRPVIRIRDILENSTNTFTPELADKKYLIRNGDILVGMDGDFHMTKWTGGEAYLNQRIARFRPQGNTSKYFLFLALREPIRYFNKIIVGTTVAHLGDSHLKSIKIKIPDLDLQEKARDVLDPLFELEISLKRQNANLRRTRDLLLPRLVSGKVSVGNMEVAGL